MFGAVSSGSVASFALGRCAEEGRSSYPEAADVLLRNTYVDDALCAVDSVEGAVCLARDLKVLCATGAFNMTKFTSSSPQFLKCVPVEDRGKNVKQLDLDKDRLCAESALGLRWSVEDDSFRFQFRGEQKPWTRRGLLSTVSSVFDPLGVVSPVIVAGHVLVQRLCALSCRWDERNDLQHYSFLLNIGFWFFHSICSHSNSNVVNRAFSLILMCKREDINP